ncbi:MAG: hypothetical protein ACRENP_21790 [Longimicrobiales bacterium]
MTRRFSALPSLFVLLVCQLTACSSILGPQDVRIRVRNASIVDFESTTLDFSNQTERYGAVSAGATTDYRGVDRAYSYAYVEVLAGGQRYVMQPIDYVGEKPLKGGSYTYELNLNPTNTQLVQRLVKD